MGAYSGKLALRLKWMDDLEETMHMVAFLYCFKDALGQNYIFIRVKLRHTLVFFPPERWIGLEDMRRHAMHVFVSAVLLVIRWILDPSVDRNEFLIIRYR